MEIITPFSWDENVTCVKDNDTNVENGCIFWTVRD